MTTPYAISSHLGSVSYDNYVNAPITGPLNTSKTPSQIPYHSYGTLTGLRPTPPQFYPYQSPVYANMNTNPRARYFRVQVSNKKISEQLALGKATPPMSHFTKSTNRYAAVSTHMNYIPPIPSSMHTSVKKDQAVGQSAFKVGLPLSAPITTKSYYPSCIKTTLSRVRGGGCVAPRKKGAIQNYSLSNGATCAWGSIVRQNY